MDADFYVTSVHNATYTMHPTPFPPCNVHRACASKTQRAACATGATCSLHRCEHTALGRADAASTHHALTRSTHTLVVWHDLAVLFAAQEYPVRARVRRRHKLPSCTTQCEHECRPGGMPTEHADGHADRACRRSMRTTADFRNTSISSMVSETADLHRHRLHARGGNMSRRAQARARKTISYAAVDTEALVCSGSRCSSP